jgi:hypothetical protein
MHEHMFANMGTKDRWLIMSLIANQDVYLMRSICMYCESMKTKDWQGTEYECRELFCVIMTMVFLGVLSRKQCDKP